MVNPQEQNINISTDLDQFIDDVTYQSCCEDPQSKTEIINLTPGDERTNQFFRMVLYLKKTKKVQFFEGEIRALLPAMGIVIVKIGLQELDDSKYYKLLKSFCKYNEFHNKHVHIRIKDLKGDDVILNQSLKKLLICGASSKENFIRQNILGRIDMNQPITKEVINQFNIMYQRSEEIYNQYCE